MHNDDALEAQQAELLARMQHWQGIKTAAGIFATEEALNLLLHAIMGNPSGLIEGALFGGIAALAAGYQAPKWLRTVRESLPHTEELEPLWLLTHREPGKRSLLDKLLDRYPEDEQEDENDEESAPMEQQATRAQVQVAHDDHLHLGATLHPHAKEVLSKRIGLFGIPGSGKTNGLTVFLEELGKLRDIGVPFVLADTEGEYDVLHHPAYLKRPYKAGAHNVTAQNAFAFGESVLERGRQVILNLQSYDDDNQAALVMIEIIRGMRTWAEARENEERATCMFILDEASIWLPQRQEESTLSREKPEGGQTLLARLQQAFFGTVVRRGRKRGIGFLFATQRPADLDKRCISCDWLILFRQTFPNDLNKYAELGVPKEVAQALAPGEAMVIDPKGDRTVHQFRQRYSPDKSQSPGLSSLEKHAARWERSEEEPMMDRRRSREEQEPWEPQPEVTAIRTLRVADLTLEQLLALINQLPEVDPTDARYAPENEDDQKVEPMYREEIPSSHQPERETELERALRAYDEGNKTMNALALALNMTPWNVRPLYTQVKKLREQIG